MTINARSEIDLEEDTIKNKVAKASGGCGHPHDCKLQWNL